MAFNICFSISNIFSVSWLLSFQIFCLSFLPKSRKGSSLLPSPFPQFPLSSHFLISLLFIFIFHSVFNPPFQYIYCAYNFTISLPSFLFLRLFLVFFSHYFCSIDSIVLGISQQNKKEVLTTAAYFKVSTPIRSQGQ